MLDLIDIGLEPERHRLSVADGSPAYVSARIGHHVVSNKAFLSKDKVYLFSFLMH